ncbi:flagellar hook-associated protein FlgK [Massilia norwichensis]|uniref:Flagellar hook-associated protein 1 n=1 Tax=Massilia norwichensis TaxID=1442366 RepID=A0ABT2ACW1_9BURK|nr:flagellar hook-associated protein FlgK [Massilia norwichensis]MCS0592054.1 flagellar hook-associated protein FlgK [Massilia norwichensis]
MSILNNALSGALASQLALSSSSQNIANLQTKGYTRQAALLSAVAPAAGSNQAGNGVRVTSLLRFSDNYKTQQLWRAASDLGAYSQTQPYLTQLETVMGNDDASLSGGIDKFFAALNAVAGVDPTSTPLRQQVVTAAGLLAQRFNSLNNVYNSQLQSVRQQRTAIVDSANTAIAAIATLNGRIANANATGSNASSLIDQRDQAIDSLASQMGLEVSDQPDGTRNVSLKTGQALVLGSVAGKLAVTGSADQAFSLSFAGTTFDLDVTRAGGQLGGLSAYEKDVLLPMQNNVAEMARQIAEKVNNQLAAGKTMDNNPGKPLFVYTPGSTSNMLQVASGFQTADLAFSGDGTPGDTANLQKLADIKNQTLTLTGLGSVLLSDADTQLVGKLAVDSQQNKGALDTFQTMREQAEADWQSTSGVNQDEEAVNLVEYQNMYQANMKVMSVANALFDATLAMMS